MSAAEKVKAALRDTLAITEEDLDQLMRNPVDVQPVLDEPTEQKE